MFDLKGNIRRFASWLSDDKKNTNQIFASQVGISDSSSSDSSIKPEEAYDDDCTIDSLSNNSTSGIELKYSMIVLPESTLLDGDFLAYKSKSPLILDEISKEILHKSVVNVSAHFIGRRDPSIYSAIVLFNAGL